MEFKELGTTMSLCLLMLYPLSNFKAIGQLVMQILHFKDLGNTESVMKLCQISRATNVPQGGGGGVSTLI